MKNIECVENPERDRTIVYVLSQTKKKIYFCHNENFFGQYVFFQLLNIRVPKKRKYLYKL